MRFADPRLSPIEPTLDFGVHRPSGIASFFVRDDLCARTFALPGKRQGARPRLAEQLALPRVDRLGVPTAESDVVRGAEETEVEMVIVRVARLTTQGFEAAQQRGRSVGRPCVFEEQGAEVLRHVDVLYLGDAIFDERADEEPGSGNIELKRNVVGWVRELSEVHTGAERIEKRADTFDWVAVRVELVEQNVDIASALMGAMARDGATPFQAEVVDRDWEPPKLTLDSLRSADQGVHDFGCAVARIRIPRGVETESRRDERKGHTAT